MPLIVDLAIHEKATLTREKYLEKTRCVQAIRSNLNRYDEGMTLYVHSLESYMLIKHLQALIVQGDFDGLNGRYQCVHAGVEVSDPLYLWLKNSTFDTVMRQIVCWLAAIYCFYGSKEVMAEQLYGPVFEEVKRVASELIGDDLDSDSMSLDEQRDAYHKAALNYYGSVPPKIIWEPMEFHPHDEIAREWWAHERFDLTIRRFYFTARDWERVVLKGEDDDLLRSESSSDYWQKIKHQYVSGASDNEPVFALFSSSPEKGSVYVVQASDSGYYKIGYTSTSPSQRLSQLQTGNPVQLSLLGSFPCVGRSTEKLLHKHFAASRMSGEWFQLQPGDVRNILSQEWRSENGIY